MRTLEDTTWSLRCSPVQGACVRACVRVRVMCSKHVARKTSSEPTHATASTRSQDSSGFVSCAVLLVPLLHAPLSRELWCVSCGIVADQQGCCQSCEWKRRRQSHLARTGSAASRTRFCPFPSHGVLTGTEPVTSASFCRVAATAPPQPLALVLQHGTVLVQILWNVYTLTHNVRVWRLGPSC